jgi:hypothetical protein
VSGEVVGLDQPQFGLGALLCEAHEYLAVLING